MESRLPGKGHTEVPGTGQSDRPGAEPPSLLCLWPLWHGCSISHPLHPSFRGEDRQSSPLSGLAPTELGIQGCSGRMGASEDTVPDPSLGNSGSCLGEASGVNSGAEGDRLPFSSGSGRWIWEGA